MISFENDYSTGAHPRILEALAATNLEPTPGYGGDRFCESAAAHIRCGLRRRDRRRVLPHGRHPDQRRGHFGAAGRARGRDCCRYGAHRRS
ncbi:MAG: hypothetical protein ACLTDR_02550 [Adlercreutzia equolifaciens]